MESPGCFYSKKQQWLSVFTLTMNTKSYSFIALLPETMKSLQLHTTSLCKHGRKSNSISYAIEANSKQNWRENCEEPLHWEWK